MAIGSASFLKAWAVYGANTGCTDGFIIYRAYSIGSLVLPSEIALSVNQIDQDNPVVQWGYQENTSPGYDTARD